MQYEADKERTFQFKTDGSVNLESVPIASELKEVLRAQMGIDSLFPMQETILNHIQDASAKRLVGDVILCAPTGSGKTLAYALPIVQSMIKRKLRRLRAIVVVPTRDLAIQVSRVFRELTQPSGIAVGVISGAASIAAESASLRNVEILIATPGRLVDHIENDDMLNLRSVRYLVLDESDRLLQDDYQGWIDSVIPVLGVDSDPEHHAFGQNPHRRPISGLLALAIQPDVSARSFTRSAQTSQECVRKVLVSATQTRNPKRLVRLGLRQPSFFEPASDLNDSTLLSSSYSVPSTLTEKGWVVRDIQDKPIALLKVLGWVDTALSKELEEDPGANAVLPVEGAKLVFTKSIEAAHRLCRLLEIFSTALGVKGEVLEMSGDLSPARRQKVIETVRESKSASESANGAPMRRSLVVVCSDVLARGMDIFSVDAVINYDVPVHIRTYLHRAGRTARAGRPGTVVTLLLSKQAHHFRSMVRQAERGRQKVQIKNMSLDNEERGFLIGKLEHALTLLRRVVTREKLGLLSPDDSLPSYALNELCDRITDAEAAEYEGSDDDGWGNDGFGWGNDGFGREDDSPHGHSVRMELSHNQSAVIAIEGQDVVDNDEVMEGEDELRDLLFAQIARNMLLNVS